MSGSTHELHPNAEERMQMVSSLRRIFQENADCTGFGYVVPPRPEDDALFHEVSSLMPVLGGRSYRGGDYVTQTQLRDELILGQTVLAATGGSGGVDVEYMVRTRSHGGYYHNPYHGSTFYVCEHQGHLQLFGSERRMAMPSSSYHYAAKLLTTAVFNSPRATRRALKELVKDDVITGIESAPRSNLGEWLLAAFRYFPPLPFR